VVKPIPRCSDRVCALLVRRGAADEESSTDRIYSRSITFVKPIPSRCFRQGLRDLGYIEDKKIVIDYRYGEGKEDLLTHAGIVDALVAAKSRGVHVAPKTDRTESAGKTRAPNLRLHS
jgi:hypothetical protein